MGKGQEGGREGGEGGRERGTEGGSEVQESEVQERGRRNLASQRRRLAGRHSDQRLRRSWRARVLQRFS